MTKPTDDHALEFGISEAVAMHRDGRLSEAEARYRSILDRCPGHPGVLHNLGVIAAQAGRHDEAIGRFDAALASDPDYASAHLNRARALNELGRMEEAARGYRRALALDPDDYDATFRLALVDNALGRRDGALQCFAETHRLRRAQATAVTASRLELAHDAARLRHLARPEADDFDALVNAIDWPEDDAARVSLTSDQVDRLAELRIRTAHRAETSEIAGSALGAGLDPAAITREYLAAAPHRAVIDDMLSPEALRSLNAFLLDSAIWFDAAHVPGFVAAYLEDGLACPLLLQVADDLRTALPGILGPHPLAQAWAFKCVRGRDSVDVHLDAAAVSVNFWTTPDAANRDPAHGGLVLYDVPPPDSWRIKGYDEDVAAIREYLAEAAETETIIPYRENRAVIFESNQFHGSDTVDFRPGYENHRINVTLLFGARAG